VLNTSYSISIEVLAPTYISQVLAGLGSSDGTVTDTTNLPTLTKALNQHKLNVYFIIIASFWELGVGTSPDGDAVPTAGYRQHHGYAQ
jgi:hypothetical protein